MRWNKKFDYPKSIRSTENGIRRYVIGDTKLPSVTSVLDLTRSDEEKAALANWRERTGHQAAEAITSAAASRGSKMHAYLESFILNRENLSFFDDGEQHKIMAKQIIEKGLINRLEEVWGVEATLFYPNRYSGTTDAVGIFDGKEYHECNEGDCNGKVFDSSTALKYHQRRKHKIHTHEERISYKYEEQCDICGKIFGSSSRTLFCKRNMLGAKEIL